MLCFFVVLAVFTLSTSFALNPPTGATKTWKSISLAAIPTMMKALEKDVSGAIDKFDAGGTKREKFSALRNDFGTSLKSFVGNSKEITHTSNGKELLWAQLAIYGMFISGTPGLLTFATKVGSIGAFGGGLFATAKAMLQLKEQNSFLLSPTRHHQLRTDGMYKHVRHPMYGGIIATCLGSAILSNSPEQLLLTGALTFVLVHCFS